MSNQSKYLIVGLGNPGKEYRRTRHNIGFMTIDSLAEKFGIRLGRVKSDAIVGDGLINKESVILAKPQTFMNLSGKSVGSLIRFYKVDYSKIMIVYDEIDLPFGQLRIREAGGSGGHNGMKSIIGQVGRGFPRMRMGVGRPPGRMDAADYVLQDFNASELLDLSEMIDRAVEAITLFLEEGIELTMSRYNS